MSGTTIDAAALTAIDVHVHLEPPAADTAADAAAAKYFGSSGAARGGAALVVYNRARKMGCVLLAEIGRASGWGRGL